MYGWVGGWMVGWMDGRVGQWVDGRVGGCAYYDCLCAPCFLYTATDPHLLYSALSPCCHYLAAGNPGARRTPFLAHSCLGMTPAPLPPSG